MVTEIVPPFNKPLLGTFKIGQGNGVQVGLVDQSEVGRHVTAVVLLGVRANPGTQLICTTEVVKPLVIGVTPLLSKPLLGTIKVGHALAAQVGEPVQLPRKQTDAVWLAYPKLQMGLQIVPLSLFMQESTFPKGGTGGRILQGLGTQSDAPLHTPARHVNVELAVKPLSHIGVQLKPLIVPTQWLCEPYIRGLAGTV